MSGSKQSIAFFFYYNFAPLRIKTKCHKCINLGRFFVQNPKLDNFGADLPHFYRNKKKCIVILANTEYRIVVLTIFYSPQNLPSFRTVKRQIRLKSCFTLIALDSSNGRLNSGLKKKDVVFESTIFQRSICNGPLQVHLTFILKCFQMKQLIF